MQRVLTIVDGNHPDTPPTIDWDLYEEGANQERYWAVYIDGNEVFGFALEELSEAERAQDIAIKSGRYEYADIRLRPTRRTNERRA